MLTTKTSNEEQDFQQISQQVCSKRTKSALYFFINNLDRENLASKLEMTITDIYWLFKKQTAREAILFSLEKPSKPLWLCDKNYQCEESHLTVDKWCATDNTIRSLMGFSMAHYTAIYRNIDDPQKTIIIHSYFNLTGKYINSQVKLSNAGAEQQLDILSQPLLEERILGDGQCAKQLLEKLLKAQSEEFFAVSERADALEKQLKDIFENKEKLSRNQFLNLYKKVAQEFIETIDLLNCYSTCQKDQRGSFVKKTLDGLTLQEKVDECTQDLEVMSLEDLQQVPSSGALKVLPKKTVVDRKSEAEKLNAELTRKWSELQAILHEISAQQEPALYLKQQDCIQDIKELLLQLIWIDGIKERIYQKYVTQLHRIPDLVEIFKNRFLKGDIKAVQVLLPRVNNRVDVCWYLKCLLDVVKDKDINEDAIVEVYKYLFDNSQAYRSLINSSKFHMLFGSEDNDDFVGVLSYLFIFKKYKLIEMLVDQGFNLNKVGMMRNQNKVISSVRALIYFSRNSNEEGLCFVMNLLLKNKIILEDEKKLEGSCWYGVDNNGVEYKEGSTKKTILKKTISCHTSSEVEKRDFGKVSNVDSCLELVCDTAINIDNLNKTFTNKFEVLIKKSSLISILLSFSSLVNIKGIRNIFAYSHNPKGVFVLVANRQEAYCNLNCFRLINNTDTCYSSYINIFYPELDSDQNIVVIMLHEQLIKKLEEGIYDANGVYNELLTIATYDDLGMLPYSREVYLKSCLYLLFIEAMIKPEKVDCQLHNIKLMHICYLLGYEYKKQSENLNTVELLSKEYYCRTKQIAQFSPNSEELQQSDWYKKATEALLYFGDSDSHTVTKAINNRKKLTH